MPSKREHIGTHNSFGTKSVSKDGKKKRYVYAQRKLSQISREENSDGGKGVVNVEQGNAKQAKKEDSFEEGH